MHYKFHTIFEQKSHNSPYYRMLSRHIDGNSTKTFIPNSSKIFLLHLPSILLKSTQTGEPTRLRIRTNASDPSNLPRLTPAKGVVFQNTQSLKFAKPVRPELTGFLFISN